MLVRVGKRKKNPDFIGEKFRNSIAIDPDEMNFIMGLASAAATYRMPHKTPVGSPVHLDMGNGEVETLKLADNPMNRGMMAIKRHCGDDGEKFFSACLRFMALGRVYNDKRFEPYMREIGDEQLCEVSAAIGHVAGAMRLDEHGHFDLDKFFAQAEEIKRTKYTDED
jgi:hypothetical protein